MESTVVNQTVPNILSGNSVCFVSLPGMDVQISSSGEARRSEVRSTLPAKMGCSSLPSKKKSDENVLLIPHFKEFMGYLIASDIPEVQAVLMHQEDKLLRVYIATKEFDFDVNERIYDKEERLINLFENVNFDFHIIGQRRFGDPNLRLVYSR